LCFLYFFPFLPIGRHIFPDFQETDLKNGKCLPAAFSMGFPEIRELCQPMRRGEMHSKSSKPFDEFKSCFLTPKNLLDHHINPLASVLLNKLLFKT
jgi:hypothetical protein